VWTVEWSLLLHRVLATVVAVVRWIGLHAIVELAEGTRVSARLLGYDPLKPEDVKLGSDVKMEYETIESGRKYLAFRPV